MARSCIRNISLNFQAFPSTEVFRPLKRISPSTCSIIDTATMAWAGCGRRIRADTPHHIPRSINVSELIHCDAPFIHHNNNKYNRLFERQSVYSWGESPAWYTSGSHQSSNVLNFELSYCNAQIDDKTMNQMNEIDIRNEIYAVAVSKEYIGRNRFSGTVLRTGRLVTVENRAVAMGKHSYGSIRTRAWCNLAIFSARTVVNTIPRLSFEKENAMIIRGVWLLSRTLQLFAFSGTFQSNHGAAAPISSFCWCLFDFVESRIDHGKT